jgi:hypothetical protein
LTLGKSFPIIASSKDSKTDVVILASQSFLELLYDGVKKAQQQENGKAQ